MQSPVRQTFQYRQTAKARKFVILNSQFIQLVATLAVGEMLTRHYSIRRES